MRVCQTNVAAPVCHHRAPLGFHFTPNMKWCRTECRKCLSAVKNQAGIKKKIVLIRISVWEMGSWSSKLFVISATFFSPVAVVELFLSCQALQSKVLLFSELLCLSSSFSISSAAATIVAHAKCLTFSRCFQPTESSVAAAGDIKHIPRSAPKHFLPCGSQARLFICTVLNTEQC